MTRLAKWLGLRGIGTAAVLGLTLLGTPATASAAGWRGGGGGMHAAAAGGGWHGSSGGGFHAAPAAGWHGGAYAQNRYVTPHAAVPYRGGYYSGYRGYAPHYGYAPRYGVGVHAGRVWVPGYWGWNNGVRIWIGGSWALPPQPGMIWVAPHWAWNGYTWVWEQGYWAPPTY